MPPPRRRVRPERASRQVCEDLAAIAGLLAALERDIASPLVDDLQAECALLLRWLRGRDPALAQARDMAQRLIRLWEGLAELTATSLPTIDEVQLRAATEKLGRGAGLLAAP